MKIKLTTRGRIVIYALLIIGIFAAIAFAILLVFKVNQFTQYQETPPYINCVADTVLQADGSCTPVEN